MAQSSSTIRYTAKSKNDVERYTMKKIISPYVCSSCGACYENYVEYLQTCPGTTVTPQLKCTESGK